MTSKEKKELKNQIRMVAFDVDGTILPFSQLSFNPNIQKMFKDLEKNNIYSIISTAREFITIGNLLDQIPEANYFIGANGMFVYDLQAKEIIYEKPIKLQNLELLYKEIWGHPDLESLTVTDLNWCYHSPGINKNTWFLTPHHAKMKEINFFEIDSKHIHIITLGSYNEETTTRLEEFVKHTIRKYNLPLEINSKWHRGLFVTPKGVTKFTALSWLANYLGLDASKNLIAFGDSSNDYEMIKYSAYGVAVGCEDKYICQIAKDIADDVKQDGTYTKLKDLQII
ncbi:YcsE-related riboflavin metabolism phosphatase [Mycoplasmopsis columbina]|uniref:YcsE-related riboflavin metabolism phosphatase n=1 Tax=Mycoplasmopsis columbina TaxID=114881 RepID=UPI0004A74FAC|nr:HAD family hydrolase [Mycoplasmopsis columbina]VEU76898.1 HAD hydrolase, family IIB [Mycoplasmopsis columbina]